MKITKESYGNILSKLGSVDLYRTGYQMNGSCYGQYIDLTRTPNPQKSALISFIATVVCDSEKEDDSEGGRKRWSIEITRIVSR